MLTESRAMEILKTALGKSGADQTEAVLMSDRTDLTRFAESTINQNISQEETTLVVTAVKDKKIGIATTNDLSVDGIASAVKTANDIGRLQPPDDNFVSFPDTAVAPKLSNTVTVEPNLQFTPGDMASVVAKVAATAKSNSLAASGAFRHDISTIAVANSLGVEQFGISGKSELSLTIVGQGEQSGFGIAFNPDPAKLDFRTPTDAAIAKALANVNPIALPDGQYTVILEPAAVGQLLLFLSFLGFGGKTMAQHRSFLSGKTDELITGANITITDDVYAPEFGAMLFDYEGIAGKQITPILEGKAGEGAFDSYYANMLDTEPTGHAVQPNNGFGPYPKHLIMQPGDATLEEMIASTEKGVLISHFWYINYLNPMKTMITGTTFDGTFLIENGKLGPAIKNMRTNQSILEAFSNVEMISQDSKVYPQYSSLMIVPALKINDFNLVQETKEEWEGTC